MNGHNEFDDWVKAARAEVPPTLDVTASVLATVRTRKAALLAADTADRAPRLAVAMAAAAAIATLVPAMQAFLSLTNPMTALMETLRTVL